MSSETALVDTQPWSSRRWLVVSLAVFSLQLVLIFWLSDKKPLQTRVPAPAPTLQFTDAGCSELLALTDPTLFALPNSQSFSGKSWLQGIPVQFRPFDWSEPIPWLPLQVQQLGT